MQNPFDAALAAAERISNPLAKSQILAELAKMQIEAGLIEDAFTNITKIPNRSEKRSVLFHLALNSVQENKTEHLFRFVQTMIEADPQSSASAGRLALALLDAGNLTMAAELVRTVEKPFDSERNRYDFVAKFIELAGNEQLADARQFIATFTDADYRDWASLALAKRLAALNQWTEAEKIAESFSLPRRKSWAFFELSRLTAGNTERAKRLLNRSSEILEAIPLEADSAEVLSVQLRILGKAVFKQVSQTNDELGARLLERSEAAAACVPMPMQRFRTQYLLAKVLREFGQIDSVQNYLNTSELAKADFSGIDRSRVLVWLAEADNNIADWSAAIQSAAEADAESAELPRAERIVEILKRFAHKNNQAVPTGEPNVDAVNLSAEEFEEYYFSAFTIADCGC